MPRKPSLSRSLVKSLESAAAPIYLLDAQRRIVYGNAAFSAWVGRPADDLAGVRCDYHASGTVSGAVELAAALCPPPEAFAGTLAGGNVAAVADGGALIQRAARFVLLPDEKAQPNLLVIVDPQVGSTAAAPPDAHELAPERLHALLMRLRSEMGRRFHLGQLIGESPELRRIREQVRIASQSGIRTLIVGPPGSGRAHVARTIHYSQTAASIGPLVPIDCALVDAEMMQSTLTALLRRQVQSPSERPPAALLLSVDRLRAEAQQELAGFLLLPGVELHTLCTARSPLQRLASKGKFRHDLAYALSTLTIALPALRSRQEDIPLLAQFFLEEFNAAGKRQLAGFAPRAIEELMAYEWPGNLDELAEMVQAACGRATGSQVTAADLPDRISLAAGAAAHPRRQDEAIQLDEFLAEIERELLERALQRTKNNKTKAAQLLGLSRGRLLRRLAQLGLAPPPAEDEPVVFEPLPDEPS